MCNNSVFVVPHVPSFWAKRCRWVLWYCNPYLWENRHSSLVHNVLSLFLMNINLLLQCNYISVEWKTKPDIFQCNTVSWMFDELVDVVSKALVVLFWNLETSALAASLFFAFKSLGPLFLQNCSRESTMCRKIYQNGKSNIVYNYNMSDSIAGW